MKNPERWTDEQDQMLRDMATTKKLVTIAHEINARTGSAFTKNAVIGRKRRLGLMALRSKHPGGSEAVVHVEAEEPAAYAPRRHWKPGRLLMKLGWLDGAFR